MFMLQYRASLASKPAIASAMGEDSKPTADTSLEFGIESLLSLFNVT
ncbi:hypothetical protein J19TS1_30150 [Heyndrickxia oleronia]|nr:hypothetical protein J19TS1_30150 [Heyndrickxia oleronia]